MKSQAYWIARANRRMDNYQLSADKQALIIGKAYQRTCTYVQSEISKILRHIGDKDSLAYEHRMRRLASLLLNTEQKMNELYGLNLQGTTEFLKKIIPEAYYHTIFDIAKGNGVQPSFATVNDRLINAIIHDQWSGANYSWRIWNNTEQLSQDVRQLLTNATMSGESINKTARKLSERFDTSLYNSKRLIRTETTYACNQAEIESYKALGIEEYRFVATLDTRTSQICRKMDGKVFKVSDAQAGKNLPAMHPNCRSTTIPVFEDFFPQNRIARDENGKPIEVPASMTYPEWHEKYVEGSSANALTSVSHTSPIVSGTASIQNTVNASPTASPVEVPKPIVTAPAVQTVASSTTGTLVQGTVSTADISTNIHGSAIDNSVQSGIIVDEKKNRNIEPLSPEAVVPVLRKTAQNWIDNLSSEEIRAIKKYTKNSGDPKDDKFYKRLNAMLRGDIPPNDTLSYYSKVISDAISKFELENDIICYRAVSQNPIKGKKIGDIYEPMQFLSSSVTEKGAFNVGGYFIAIVTPKGSKGAYIEQLSKFPKQREFLFDKDVKYKIMAINGKRIILEAIV